MAKREPREGEGGQPGNDNGAKGAEYRHALRRAMARKEGTLSEALIKLGTKCYEAALDGEPWALKEIADRFDGKPAQSLTVSGDKDNPLYGSGLAELYVGAGPVSDTGDTSTDSSEPE